MLFQVSTKTTSHFLAFEHHVGLDASELSGIYWEEWVSPYLNPLDYFWTPCWKSTINSSQSLRWLVSWKDRLERATTITHQQSGGELHQALDCLRGCQWWSLRASADLSVSKSASASHHQKQMVMYRNRVSKLNRLGADKECDRRTRTEQLLATSRSNDAR